MIFYDFQTVNFAESVRDSLTDGEIQDLSSKVQDSGRFGMVGKKVVLSKTSTIVGYLGDRVAGLCYPNGEDSENYRVPHKHLRRIFKSV